jgi:hypothetical protein
MAGGVVFQSLVLADGQAHLSYLDPESRGPHGLVINTAVMDLDVLGPELAEVTDAFLQLLSAWEGKQRESRRGAGP